MRVILEVHWTGEDKCESIERERKKTETQNQISNRKSSLNIRRGIKNIYIQYDLNSVQEYKNENYFHILFVPSETRYICVLTLHLPQFFSIAKNTNISFICIVFIGSI